MFARNFIVEKNSSRKECVRLDSLHLTFEFQNEVLPLADDAKKQILPEGNLMYPKINGVSCPLEVSIDVLWLWKDL